MHIVAMNKDSSCTHVRSSASLIVCLPDEGLVGKKGWPLEGVGREEGLAEWVKRVQEASTSLPIEIWKHSTGK